MIFIRKKISLLIKLTPTAFSCWNKPSSTLELLPFFENNMTFLPTPTLLFKYCLRIQKSVRFYLQFGISFVVCCCTDQYDIWIHLSSLCDLWYDLLIVLNWEPTQRLSTWMSKSFIQIIDRKRCLKLLYDCK